MNLLYQVPPLRVTVVERVTVYQKLPAFIAESLCTEIND